MCEKTGEADVAGSKGMPLDPAVKFSGLCGEEHQGGDLTGEPFK